jgi:hypothetical protein
LKKLREAGLDEIRFNICARGYDLAPVALAANFIDAVTVEIPSVPEDRTIVQRALKKMEKAGVRHLNLHQLNASEHNYRAFARKNYTFLHQRGIPILESELAALSLIRHALDHHLTLSISYCSDAYKARLQGRGYRMRISPWVREEHESITSSGYIRRLSMRDSPERLQRRVQTLAGQGFGSHLWSMEDSGRELAVHPSLLEFVGSGRDAKFRVAYWDAQLNDEPSPPGREISLNASKKIYVKRIPVAQYEGLSPWGIRAFRKLYLDPSGEEEALREFCREFDFRTREGAKEMVQEKNRLGSLKRWERVESGFPELF